jgi:phosphoribosyl-dephospho-CoA transferase
MSWPDRRACAKRGVKGSLLVLVGFAAAGNEGYVHAPSRALGQEVHHLRERLPLARLVALGQADGVVERVAAEPARTASLMLPTPQP